MAVRYFTLLIGIAFVLAGVGGFLHPITQPANDLPELTVQANYGKLLGLFPINVVHNLVHLSLGIWGLAAYRQYESARFYAKSLAVILGIFTIMGLFPRLNVTFGLMPLFGHDIWLHALEAIIAAYLGFIASPQSVRRRLAEGTSYEGR